MEIYKKRLIKTVYNSYLVTSDIEGATVIFDGEEVGTIQNGSFTFRIPQKTDLSDSHTISIKENTGTLYQKPTDYVLSTDYTEENRLQISNLKNDIIDFSSYVTSTKTTYTQSYPTQVTVENITQEINLNTVQTPNTTTVPVTGELDINANHTTNVVEGFVEITQDESNNKINLYYSQAAGVQTQFTVNSNIEGASVAISYITSTSNMKTGNIVDGTCTINYWQDEWEEGQMQAAITGDSSLLTPTQETYTFENLTEDPVIFQGVGGTFNISEYWNIISTFGQTTYSYPSTSSIGPTHTITLNEVPYTESGVTKSYSPTQLNLTAVTAVQDSSIQITQEESGKTLDLPYHQNAMALHTYTVYSDIEGAAVTFGNKGTAVVTGGQAVLSLYDNEAENSLSVSISGGTLVTEDTKYVFERNSTSLPNISADGGSINFSSYVTSYKIVHSSSYPSQTTVNKNSSVTMNTVISDSQQNLSFTPPSYDANENETDRSISYPITLTQTESNKTISFSVTQSAGVRYSYTVYSNAVNGTSVAFNGSIVGQVNSSGIYTHYVWNSKAPTSYSVTFPNGFGKTPSASTYTFNISSSSLSFGENGGTKYSNVSSYRTDYSYNNPSGTVGRNSSVTLNATQSSSNTNISYSYTSKPSWISSVSTSSYTQVSLTASANSGYSSRSGTVSFSQSGSGKTDSISVSQDAKSLYTYTINSNCNGGTVYFNNINKGTISNGKCTFTDTASSGTVRISGGVPSNYTQTTDSGTSTISSTTEYDYDFSITSGSSSQSFGANGGSSSITVDSSRKSRSVYVYQDYETTRLVSYSAPSSRIVSGNNSVTMNYSGPNYGSESTSWGSQYTEYGSWSGWSRVSTSWKYGDPSWISKSSSNSGSYNIIWSFNCSANNSTSSRSDYDELIQSGSNDSIRVNFSQSGQTVEYVFETVGTLGYHKADASTSEHDSNIGGSIGVKCYKKIGNTYERLGISFASGGKPSQVYDYQAVNGSTYGENKGTNTGWTFYVNFNQSPYVKAWDDNSHSHSYNVVMQQAESGKKLTIPCKQRDYVCFLTNAGTTTKSETVSANGGNGGTTWVIAKDGYSGKNWTASWTGGSWAHLNNSGASITAATGATLQINCNANTSTSSRSGSCKIGIVGHPVQEACRIDVTQNGAAVQSFGFTFNISNPRTYTAYTISTSSISSISGTFRGMFLYSVETLPSNITTVINSSNGTFTTNAFSSTGQSKSFKLWAVPTSGDSGSLILKATFTVSEGGSYTYTGSW